MELKYVPCRRCVDSHIKGHYLKDGVLRQCPCYTKYKNKLALSLKLKDANIPIDCIEYDINSYTGTTSTRSVDKVKKYVEVYKDKGRNQHLYFVGSNSTQKTTLAFYIARELIKQGVSVLYVSTMDYLMVKLGVFDNQRDYETKEFLQAIEQVDLLIIDECFSRKYDHSVSDYQINNLKTFLKNRLEIYKKSSIFISNTLIEGIEKRGFTFTIQSLIKRNTNNNVLIFEDVVGGGLNINNLWED